MFKQAPPHWSTYYDDVSICCHVSSLHHSMDGFPLRRLPFINTPTFRGETFFAIFGSRKWKLQSLLRPNIWTLVWILNFNADGSNLSTQTNCCDLLSCLVNFVTRDETQLQTESPLVEVWASVSGFIHTSEEETLVVSFRRNPGGLMKTK